MKYCRNIKKVLIVGLWWINETGRGTCILKLRFDVCYPLGLVADFIKAANMAGGKKKSSSSPSRFYKTLSSLWQDKHLVLFKAEYTFLITTVLWFLEIGINMWVIQRVACKFRTDEKLPRDP